MTATTMRRTHAPIPNVHHARPFADESGVKIINLALQGGGAHGAFTWGVLDRLLEDERISFEGISGTSAGAMNAAVLADGWMRGGRDGARERLEAFWRRISVAGRANPVQRTVFDRLLNGWNMDLSPAYHGFMALTRVFSPYDLNPMNINPLRDILEEMIDFDSLSRCVAIKLFISATNVHSGKIRVFQCGELTPDVLLASACQPTMFQAVEIDGETYWDGGYVGNPPIFPLIYDCRSPDVLVIQINPFHRPETPTRAHEILDRVTEISFNASLVKEMRAINFVSKLIDEERLDPSKYKRLNMHLIEAEEHMKGLGVSSKLNADWDFLVHLRDIGRETTAGWLDRNAERIGVESTMDIERYL